MRTISCATCHATCQASRPNAKYCPLCRLLKNCEYVAEKTVDCWGCNKEFAPTYAKEILCGDCHVHGAPPAPVECAFCHETKEPVITGVKVCNRCARDPKLRRRFVGSLINRQRKNLEQPKLEVVTCAAELAI